MKIFYLLSLFLFWYQLPAQIIRSPLSSPYTGIGTYSKNFTDAFSVINNQASLANYKQGAAGIYSERRFLLKELSNVTASVIMPFRQGGIGINAHYFGDAHFSNSQVGLAYGKKLSEQVDLGIQFNYNTIRVAGYGSSGAVTIEIGSLWQLTKKMQMGLHVYNPAGGKFGKQSQEKLAAIYKAGIGYEASDKFFISTELVKEEHQSITVNAGMQYQFAQQFFTRALVSTATGQFAAGIGVRWKKIRLEIVSSYNPRFGFSPALLLLFDFNKMEGQNKSPQ
jgi:hypothetical protein